jgi:hypothetical protein
MPSKLIQSVHSKKIEDLFRNRLVNPLAQEVLDADEYSHWRLSAAAIQEAIYKIDTYYESYRTLYVSTEQPMWESVESRIKESNGHSSFSMWKSFSELRQYGLLEARIHAFDIIDPREFNQIVSLKSSDVAIARALIWSYAHTPPRSVLNFWSCFDQCGELIEDLADVTEDGRDWNFNFWLYSYMAKRGVGESIIGASQTLRQKLSALEDAYMRLPHADRDRCASVMQQTLRAGRRTINQCGIVFELVAHGTILQYDQEQDVLDGVA